MNNNYLSSNPSLLSMIKLIDVSPTAMKNVMDKITPGAINSENYYHFKIGLWITKEVEVLDDET